MKYEHPVIQIIMTIDDIITLSGGEGDGGEFDPSILNSPNNVNVEW